MTKERRQVKKLEVRPSRLVFSSLLEFVTFSRVNSSVIRTMSGLISSLGGSLSDLKLFLFFRHYLQDSCVKTSGTEKEQRASEATCEGEVVAEEGGERALSLSSLGRIRELEGAAFVEFVAGLTREQVDVFGK
ncbi:hypothetical protein Bca4012_092819 [Brassica carinata]